MIYLVLDIGIVVQIRPFYCHFLVMAASSIANIVKSSLGPVGLDKMLVDDIGVSILLPKLLYIQIY